MERNNKRNNRGNNTDLAALLSTLPQATADITGAAGYRTVRGRVRFYQSRYGVFVVTELVGLPRGSGCASPIFGYHIHGGAACEGSAADPFSEAGAHYDKRECPHPYHAGDLPPLWGAGGNAFSVVLTDRLTVDEIIGKTIVVHGDLDDLTTQPAGNAGKRIACGEIRAVTG